ncbi:MAG: hypothetical protein RI897_2363 [Verrucomicrobiota bacterium]
MVEGEESFAVADELEQVGFGGVRDRFPHVVGDEDIEVVCFLGVEPGLCFRVDYVCDLDGRVGGEDGVELVGVVAVTAGDEQDADCFGGGLGGGGDDGEEGDEEQDELLHGQVGWGVLVVFSHGRFGAEILILDRLTAPGGRYSVQGSK